MSRSTRYRRSSFSTTGVYWKISQDDVTVLIVACKVFRREFMQIGNLEIFIVSIIFASACNKFLRKRFLQPDTIGLIPPGGYACNHNYSKKTLIWLLHIEQIDWLKIMHSRNGCDFKESELPTLV